MPAHGNPLCRQLVRTDTPREAEGGAEADEVEQSDHQEGRLPTLEARGQLFTRCRRDKARISLVAVGPDASDGAVPCCRGLV